MDSGHREEVYWIDEYLIRLSSNKGKIRQKDWRLFNKNKINMIVFISQILSPGADLKCILFWEYNILVRTRKNL